MSNPSRGYQSRRSSRQREGYLEAEQAYVSPRHGWTSAIIIGIIGGIIAALLFLLIVYLNASVFNAGNRLGDNMSNATAFSTFGSLCLSVFINVLLIPLGVGIATGTISLNRRQSFSAGILVEFIAAIGTIFILGGNTAVVALILLFPFALIAGLMSLAGRVGGSRLRELLGK